MTRLDTVIVGPNAGDFARTAERVKMSESASGAYCEIKTNSVLIDGRRLNYMQTLNEAATRGTGADPGLDIFEQPSASVCYLTSFLAKRGFAVDFVNSFRRDRDKLEALLAESPRSVSVTTTFYVENDPLAEVVEFVRSRAPETTIIAGGPHIFNLCSDYDVETQDYIFGSLGADAYVFDSQGESTLAALLRSLKDEQKPCLSSIPNVICKEDGGFARGERQVEENSLDDNLVDWSLFDADFVTPTVYLRTARSCPFSCSFCNYPSMAGAHQVTSLDALEREMRQLRETGVERLVVVDDTFNVPLPRFKKLLRMMIRNDFGFSWMSFFRCSNADDEAFELMRESGCAGVFLGIESGDQRILNNMDKFAKVDRYKYGIAKLKEHGILSFASFIVGFPGETEESVLNTLEFIEDTGPDLFNPQLYYHDRRAPIGKRTEEFGIRGGGYNWSHDSMDWRTAASWVEHLFRKVRSSTPITAVAFSLWGIFYLQERGLPSDKIAECLRLAGPLLVESLDEVDSSREGRFGKLVEAFRT